MIKRIMSLMLALLMVMSMLPVTAFAADEIDVSLTPSEGDVSAPDAEACPTCGETDCDSQHLNWCETCKADDCGVDHGALIDEETQAPACNCSAAEGEVHAATCPAYTCPECGIAGWHENCPESEDEGDEPTACETCGNEVCTCETVDEGEDDPDNYNSHIGKYVVMNANVVSMTVLDKTVPVESEFYHEDFEEGTILRIANWEMDAETEKLWYQVEFYKGGVTGPYAGGWPVTPWVWQNNPAGDAFVFVDTCTVCGKPDCSGEHNENPCGCCDECTGDDECACQCEECACKSTECGCCDECTGDEACACQCGECDFCEKEEEPTVPSISATVTDSNGNQQTVTVSGEALPEGAELSVMPVANEAAIMAELGMTGGFIWDIKVYDADGNEWQPADGASVKMTLPVAGVPKGAYAEIVHFLDQQELVESGIADNAIFSALLPTNSTLLQNVLSKSISAYQEATKTSEIGVAFEVVRAVAEEGSYISINANSFSVWSWNNGYNWERFSAGDRDDEIQIYGSNNKSTFYAPVGQTITFDTNTGTTGASKWYVNSSGNTQSLYDKTSVQCTMTVASTAIGTRITVGFNRSWPYDDIEVYIVVVDERKVTFDENGHGYGQLTENGSDVDDGEPGTKYDFYVNDGSGHVSYVVPPRLTETGYTNTKWNTLANGKGTDVAIGANYTPPAGNSTLYAQWEPIKYTVKFDPNTANAGNGTVTGSMPTLYMTYDVENTLPENKFVNSADGYVFLGWATSPTGDVAYRDGAKIKNLTTTSNDTVTLYAKWKYALNSTVYIGINNSYHNPKGTYTAGGVTIDSYHAFPNEPAQMTADFDRVTDDKGAWRYDTASAVPLKNTAASYINGNIFNHREYGMTKVQGENTLGLHDPTGVDVRAMLKFTEADYNAMIDVWLTGMKNTLIGYGDPNMDWANAKADDFVMIPYVIKLQNYDSWYIDMAVVEKELYTLGYDGNIENGYTITFNGVAFPPSAQYHAGDVAAVVETPIGYKNNNLKVTKVVNGITFEAEFLYWEDEQGHKYGNGNANTITMDGNKTLKAVWKYPDQTEGALRVGKEVTVPADTGLVADTTKAFTINVTLSKSGTYDYTTYDANGFASGTGSFTGTSKSFALKAHEYVVITGIEAGTDYTVSETVPTGYVNKAGTITGKIQAGNTMAATIVNEPSSNKIFFDFNGGSNTNTNVTVVYGSTNYYDVSWLKPTREGHEFAGWFTAKDGGTKVYGENGICITGSYWNSNRWIGTADLPLFAHWTAKKYTVKGTIDNEGTVTNPDQTVEHGKTNTQMVFTPADGYEIYKITVNGEDIATYKPSEFSFTQVIVEDTEVVVKTRRSSFTITWQNDDGTVIDTTTVNYGDVPTHADPTKTADDQYTYTFAGWTPQIVAVTGDATYKATYTKTVNKYTVTFVDEDGTELSSAKYDYGTPATSIVKPSEPTKAADAQYTYTFKEWTPEVVAVTGDATYKAVYEKSLNKYTVKWVDGDGKTIKTEELEYGTTPVYSGNTPTKSSTDMYSYTFNGKWSPEITDVNGNANYVAQFDSELMKYTVTVIYDETQVTVTGMDGFVKNENLWQKEYTYGSTVNIDFDPIEGYEITGIDMNGISMGTATDGVISDQLVHGDIIFTVNSKIKTYTVTFVDDDGDVISQETYEHGTPAAKIIKPADPEKAPTEEFTYTFAGWTPDFVDVTAPAIYTANYTAVTNTYTVSYKLGFEGNANVQTNADMFPDQTKIYGVTLKLYNITPTATGAEFKGWDANGDGKADYGIGVDYTGNAPLTLEALWNPVPYDVTYVVEGIPEETAKNLFTNTSGFYGNTVVLQEVPTVEGYTFESLSVSAGSYNSATRELVMPAADVVVTVKYTVNKYTVTWLNYDGTLLETDSEVPFGTVPSYDGAEPERAQDDRYTYTFAGWNPEVAEVAGNVTYTAKFSTTLRKYTLSGEIDRGTVTSSVIVDYSQLAKITFIPAEGYKFYSWKINDGSPNLITTPAASWSYQDPQLKTNKHVYVTTTPIDYTITYDLVGGALEEGKNNPVEYSIESDTFTLHNPTRTGYTFAGWTGTDLTGSPDTVTVEKGSIGNRSYTATWAPIDYTITYDLAGGALEEGKNNPVEYSIESDTFTLHNPTKTGYTFKGWTGTDLTGASDNVTIETGSIGNRSYTATWEINEYTLSVEWATPAHGKEITPSDSVTVEYGNEAVITFTTKNGYIITHLIENGVETVRYTREVMSVTHKESRLEEDIHIVAYTAPMPFTVTYDLAGGTLPEGVDSNVQNYNIEQEVVLMAEPTRGGYKFKGWKFTGADADYSNWEDGTFNAGESFTGKFGYVSFEAQWELALVDLTITAQCSDSNESFVFTVSGDRSDGIEFKPIEVVLCAENNFRVTVKDMPVGVYTVTEKDGWSWRESTVSSKQADIRTAGTTLDFQFGIIDRLVWLSGYSYNRKKGGNG